MAQGAIDDGLATMGAQAGPRLTRTWLDVVLALRYGRDPSGPDPAVGLTILQELAARMQKLRKQRRGKDAGLTGEVGYPAVARERLRGELTTILDATPGAELFEVGRLLDALCAPPALLRPIEDGNLRFATANLHALLAGGGTLRQARRVGTPEAAVMRELWRAHPWRPLARSLLEEHMSPEALLGSVFELVSDDVTPTDWTLVMFLAVDLVERRPWPRGAHLSLVHRCFDAVATRVAVGKIGGQVVTDALAAVAPGHPGARAFHAWLEASFEQGSSWLATAGAAFALSAVDGHAMRSRLLAGAEKPEIAALALQLSAGPLLGHDIIRQLPPGVLDAAVQRVPDSLVLPLAVRCLVQGGPAGLARGLVRRLVVHFHELQRDLRTWRERSGDGSSDWLETSLKGRTLPALPLAPRSAAEPPCDAVRTVPLVVPVLTRWRQTIREALDELLAYGGAGAKAFREALVGFEDAPARVPLDADPAFALKSGASYAAAYGSKRTRAAVFTFGAEPSVQRAADAGQVADEDREGLSDDAYFALRMGSALATYVTMATAPGERHAIHLQARLSSLDVVRQWDAIRRFLDAVWAPGVGTPLARLADELRAFAGATTGL